MKSSSSSHSRTSSRHDIIRHSVITKADHPSCVHREVYCATIDSYRFNVFNSMAVGLIFYARGNVLFGYDIKLSRSIEML